MDHQQASELFSAYYDQQLDDERRRALDEHLAGCADCRRDYQLFSRTLQAVSTMERAPAPTDFSSGVIDRIRRRSQGRFFAPRKGLDRIPYELLSLVMLAVILIVYVVFQLGQPGQLKLP